MMRKSVMALMAAGMLTLAACGNSAEEETVQGDVYPVKNEAPKVTVSRFVDFGPINEDVYGSFADADTIKAFEEAVGSAQRMEGQLDVGAADYDVVIERDGVPKAIRLWIDDAAEEGAKGMFVDASDSGIGYTLTADATKKLGELIRGIEYTAEQAEKNGDVVLALDGIKNPATWVQFAERVKQKKPGQVQITAYTVEGDPIFYNLSYNGGDDIRYRFDTTHDAFGSPEKREEFCGEIAETMTDKGMEYRLKSCGANRDQESKTFSILIPG